MRRFARAPAFWPDYSFTAAYSSPTSFRLSDLMVPGLVRPSLTGPNSILARSMNPGDPPLRACAVRHACGPRAAPPRPAPAGRAPARIAKLSALARPSSSSTPLEACGPGRAGSGRGPWPSISSARHSSGASAGWPAHRRWSAAAGPRSRCRAGPRGTAAVASSPYIVGQGTAAPAGRPWWRPRRWACSARSRPGRARSGMRLPSTWMICGPGSTLAPNSPHDLPVQR